MKGGGGGGGEGIGFRGFEWVLNINCKVESCRAC